MYIACTFTDQPRSVGCSEWRSLGSPSRDAVDQPGGTWCVHTPASCTSDLRHTCCSDVCTSDTADATSCAEVRAILKKRGGGACTGCASAPSIMYLQTQTLALTQPRLWKVSQGQQTRQAFELSVEPQTPQVQKALEVGLPTQAQEI